MYNSSVEDHIDKWLTLLRQVRELFNRDKALYQRIKKIPLKSRVLRRGTQTSAAETIVYLSSERKTEYFVVSDDKVKSLEFLQIAERMKAKKSEQSLPWDHADAAIIQAHFNAVKRAIEKFRAESSSQVNRSGVQGTHDPVNTKAIAFFRKCIRWGHKSGTESSNFLVKQCEELASYIEEGIYSKLQRDVKKIDDKFRSYGEAPLPLPQWKELTAVIEKLYHGYAICRESLSLPTVDSDPIIVISETFTR